MNDFEALALLLESALKSEEVLGDYIANHGPTEGDAEIGRSTRSAVAKSRFALAEIRARRARRASP